MRAVAFWGEIRKNLLIIWSYKFKAVLDAVGFALMYIAAMFFLGQGEFQRDLLESALIGFLMSFFILEMLSQMGNDMMVRAQTGTLEQLYMGVISPIWLLLAHILAILIKSVVVAVLMGAALVVLLDIDVTFLKLSGLLLLGITLVGVMGFGFLIAGVTIIYKQIGSLVNILFNLILFLNGTFLPLDRMPDWMQTLSKLIPTTQGIVLLRDVLLEGQSLTTLAENGDLFVLVIHSVLFLLLGIGIYQVSQFKARSDGSLGQY